MADTRDLIVKIKGDTKDFESSMKNVSGAANQGQMSFAKLTGAVAAGQAAFNLAADAVHKVSGFLTSSFTQYEEAETSQKQLQHAVIDVTGATQEQLKATNDLADALSRKGVLDDDVIRQGLAQLSTFGLTNASVQKLAKSMADLTVNQFGVSASGEDAVTAANIMAKALNGNFGALEKMGIHLTEAQRQLIKFGNETQRVNTINEVLSANLRTNQATALDTTAGKIAHLKVQYGNLKEAVGGFLASFADKFVVAMSNWIDKVGGVDGLLKLMRQEFDKLKPYFPEIAGIIVGVLIPPIIAAAGAFAGFIAEIAPFVAVGALVGAAVEALVKHFGGWKKVMKDLEPLWKDTKRAIGDIKYYAKEAADKLQELWDKFTQLKGVQAVSTILNGAVDDVKNHFKGLYDGAHNINDVIKDTVKGFQDLWDKFTQLTPVIILGQWFQQVLWPILKDIAKTLWTDLAPAFKHLIDSVVRLWNSLNPGLIDALKVVAGLLGAALIIAITIAVGTLDVLIRVFSFVVSAISDVIGWVSNLINWFGNLVGVVINAVKTIVDIFANIVPAVKDVFGTVIGIFKGLWDLIWGAIKDIAGKMYNAGKDMIKGLVNGIKDSLRDVEDAVGNIGKSAVNKLKGVLGIHSPSKVFADIGDNMGKGLIAGLSGTTNDIKSAVNDIASPSIQVAQNATQGTVAAASSQTTVAPAANHTFNLEVNVGMYAGMPVEKRDIALELWKEVVRAARAQGIQLPMIGAVGVQ